MWAPIALLAAGAVLAAVIDILWRPGKDRWQTALQTWEVRLFVLAAIGAVALIAVPWLASRAAHVSNPGTKGAQIDEAAGDGVFRTLVAAASSIVALAGAAITHVRGTIKDHQKTIKAVEGRSAKFAATARDGLVAIAVMLAGPLLLVAVASLGVLVSVNSADHGRTLLGAAALLLLVMWIFVDLTTVSLHPFYRRRLASAFALAPGRHRRCGDRRGATLRRPRRAIEAGRGRRLADADRLRCRQRVRPWCDAARASGGQLHLQPDRHRRPTHRCSRRPFTYESLSRNRRA